MRPTDALPRPAAWCTTTVRRSVELTRGVSWSKEQEHSEPGPDRMPVIGIKNIQDRLELNDLLYLSGLSSSDVEKAQVSADWTVIVGSNGNRNRIGNAQLIRNDAGFLFASFLIGAKPKSDSGLRPDYFFRWLSSEQVQSYLSASAEGTTGLSNLSHSFFKSMSIPVPPPEEQAAIALILDAVDTALERTREASERAKNLLASVVADLLGRGVSGNGRLRCPQEYPGAFAVTGLGKLPRDWRLSTVGDEFDVQSGFTLNSERRPRFQKRRYLRVANVRRDLLDLSDVQELEAKEDEFARQLHNLPAPNKRSPRRTRSRRRRVVPVSPLVRISHRCFGRQSVARAY